MFCKLNDESLKNDQEEVLQLALRCIQLLFHPLKVLDGDWLVVIVFFARPRGFEVGLQLFDLFDLDTDGQVKYLPNIRSANERINV